MKKFMKFFVFAIVVTVIASMFVMNGSAAAVTDPHDLKPGSDNVVFIMDAPEGGELPGDGTGRDADNPYQPIDHELFDPEKKNRYYNTAIYQATEMLQATGGTIVICGPVYLDINDGGGDHANTADVWLAANGTNTIKFTSVYNGVDYREKNGAKLTIERPAEIGLAGQSIWENIDIETSGTDRLIHCGHYATLFGEGIKCYPKEEDFATVSSYYVSISGGHRYEGGHDLTPNIVVQSGTYNIICAGIWGANNWRSTTTKGTYNNDGATQAKMTLEGTTTVLGKIIGTTRQASEFSGMTEIVINGGTYKCDIEGVGATGMVNRDGIAKITINGGNFVDCWTVVPAATGHTMNSPAASILDLSGFKGEKASLAKIYESATLVENEQFTSLKLPEDVTAEELAQAATETTAAPTPDTNSGVVVETVPVGDGNVVVGTDAPETDKQAGGKVDVTGNDGGMNLGLIIGIAVAVVAVAAVVVVVIVVSKKKKANKEAK